MQRLFRLQNVIFLLFAVYLFLYPGSITLVALDRVPVWGTWMGGALLILQGTLMGCWLAVNYRWYGVVATGLILFISWLVEHVGATTGFPFGTYTYTDVLQPQIFGVVPLAIPFAWLLIVTAAVGVAEQIWIRQNNNDDRRLSITKVLMAASFAVLLDITIEPFAVHINHYWVWSNVEPGSYYGIPASNFIAWWITSLILVWVLLFQRRRAAQQRNRPGQVFWLWLPMTLYISNLTMFVVVNVARGQVLAGIVGSLLMLVLAFERFLPHMMRRLRGTSPAQ
ncbi:MAG: carotenoid biosynthesis protein [Oscillochloris sp.]|nr:carotenoid biosynthesis protein [Oscillochloris sp.]